MNVRAEGPARRMTALIALVALLAAGSLALATSAGATRHRYPKDLERSFVRTCARAAKATAGSSLTKRQAATYCRTALTCIERHLTLRQFVRTVTRMRSGRRNPDARVLRRCEKQAIGKLRG
jgi:hypothetical protein